MYRLYQNLPVEGVEFENPNRKDSKFWNKGKWDNFILPLLPPDVEDRTFLELGCNAGMFPMLAKQLGFRHSYGIDSDNEALNIGRKYCREQDLDCDLLQSVVGFDFDIEWFPLLDVVVMSCAHYYWDFDVFQRLVDKLRYRCLSVIIVTRPLRKHKHWKAPFDVQRLKQVFREWIYKDVFADPVSLRGDPSPRRLVALRFDSPILHRIPIEWALPTQEDDTSLLMMRDLTKEVLTNPNPDIRGSDYYKFWYSRKRKKWPEEEIMSFVMRKVRLVKDLRDHGQREPILFLNRNKLSDGGHRSNILYTMGHKTVIARNV